MGNYLSCAWVIMGNYLSSAWVIMENYLSFGYLEGPTDSGSVPKGVRKSTDALYELYAPDAGDPEVDIIFFHGLQPLDYVDAYWKTWSSDGRTNWPGKFLREDFPMARVLSVSYDSCALKTAKGGKFDLYMIGESMVYNILLDENANVVQGGRPVILVGHSLGGIVIKQFLLHAARISVLKENALKGFLDKSLAGVFFYATPHLGSKLANMTSKHSRAGSLMHLLRTSEVEQTRLNNDFCNWRKEPPRRIPVFTIAEGQPTRFWGINRILVPEESARVDTDGYYTAGDADHFNVCKPADKTARTYEFLRSFITTNVSGKQTCDSSALQQLL